MEGFLEQVAADLWARYGEGVSSLSVVFPSRRASLFFGEALAGLISRPVWSPRPVTIDQVATELSGMAVGDHLRLVTELYKVWAESHPEDDFDSFYFWGELLLADFDGVDKYLVDADTLFSNLVDIHELDFRFDYLEPDQRAAIERFWGAFNSGGSSPEKRDFLTVWRTLGPVYHRYRERLRTLGIAYQGMVYREAAERIASGRAPELPQRRYVIAGFNALSRSERVMFDHLRDNFATDFYWDHDNYFTGDTGQEAGMFMRENLKRYPSAGRLRGGHDNFLKPKTIRSVAAASDVLQCKWAGGALADPARESGRPPGRETAVVLCDEGLLEPLLWSMPPEVSGINITMGCPLRLHPAYTFVERLVELQNRQRGNAFYHSDVEGLVRHPFLQSADSPVSPKNNYVYIGAARLCTTPLFEKIFSAPEGWRELSDYLIEVLSEVAGSPPADGCESKADGMALHGVIDPTALFPMIADHIRSLKNSLEGSGVELSTKTWARLLRRTLQSVTIPFEGEPLEGVQVMGILETRALDFDRVIFLSAGDDKMPGSLVGAPSFIPHNLKAAYGLPTPQHHEGVYAYHFFRLISRAAHIDVVWSSTADDRSSGAPSRYLLQLDYESPHTVESRSVWVDVNLSPVEEIVVAKNAEVMSVLGEFLRGNDPRPLSPSLLYSYVECPLKFYFRGVARLRPEEQVAEEIDGALLGNILHRAMQLLYAPLKNVRDPRHRIRELIGSEAVERAVSDAVTELYPGGESDGPEDWGGAVMLARGTIVDYINRGILPYDAALSESFTVEGLEEPVSGEVSFDGGRVVFRGVADRVDRLADGTIRVVDYKTGNPKSNASALLQMGLYAMMLQRDRAVDPALYYVREMSRPDYTPPPVEQGEEFEQDLHETLTGLFDPSTSFTQTPDRRTCEWCDFRVICRR
jgi:RecB family exonuclease